MLGPEAQPNIADRVPGLQLMMKVLKPPLTQRPEAVVRIHVSRLRYHGA